MGIAVSSLYGTGESEHDALIPNKKSEDGIRHFMLTQKFWLYFEDTTLIGCRQVVPKSLVVSGFIDESH